MTCRLEPQSVPEDLLAAAHAAGSSGIRSFLHHDDSPKVLIVTVHDVTRPLDYAHRFWFGIRTWRSMSVGMKGSLAARLADSRKIGRMRGPGERSPVPLPDWYDLTHLVRGHLELGFDPAGEVIMVLPGSRQEYVNSAEALHVEQAK